MAAVEAISCGVSSRHALLFALWLYSGHSTLSPELRDVSYLPGFTMTAGLCELDQLSLVLSQFPLEFKPGGVGPSTHLKLTLSMNTLAFAHTHKITQRFFNEL
jgi:hypothetical protein